MATKTWSSRRLLPEALARPRTSFTARPCAFHPCGILANDGEGDGEGVRDERRGEKACRNGGMVDNRLCSDLHA